MPQRCLIRFVAPLLAVALLATAAALLTTAFAQDDDVGGDDERGGFADDRGGFSDDDRGFSDDRGGFSDDDGGFDDDGAGGAAGAREPEYFEGPEFSDLRRDDFAADEVLALGLDEKQIGALRSSGFDLLQQRSLAQFGSNEVRFKIPPNMRIRQALDQVKALAGRGRADLNHYYRVSNATCRGQHCVATKLISWPAAGGDCAAAAPIGMIDTGVDRKHPALLRQNIEAVTVRGPGHQASGYSHGTAIASILAGAADSPAPGLLPGARVIAVDAFHRAGRSEDRMDAFDFVAAIDTLVARGVKLINLSFAGPPNALVEQSIKNAHARGVLLVAAAGNEGPRAKPRYPAAYDDVVAVTAVRADMQIYRRAIHGAHIDVSAPGVDVWAADPAARGSSAKALSGTSYAAPFVTASLALLMQQSPRKDVTAIKQALLASTKDLGASGHDPVFGHGLVQASALCAKK